MKCWKACSPVIIAVIAIAEQLRTITVVVGPNTNDEEAIKCRKIIGSSKVYTVDPWVRDFVDCKEEVLLTGPFVAALTAKVANELVFWWSPSNREISGFVGTSRAIAMRSTRLYIQPPHKYHVIWYTKIILWNIVILYFIFCYILTIQFYQYQQSI